MISRRLSKTEKDEILEAYRGGQNTNALAEKYRCSPNTINRTVKTLLTDSEYKQVKKQRLNLKNKKEQLVSNQIFENKNIVSEKDNSFFLLQGNDREENKSINKDSDLSNTELGREGSIFSVDVEDFSIKTSSEGKDIDNSNTDQINQNSDNSFKEIAPLISDFQFDLEKQKLDFELHNYEILPESVYMLVDKKVELEIQTISDFPEWNFLPENELKRNAILLFSNQRSAKRSCSKSQRVIKVPNTNVFKVSKSYLISKGITRLIIEDSLIALDD